MRKLVTQLLLAAMVLLSGTAFAGGSCVWAPGKKVGVEQSAPQINVNVGGLALVQVTVDSKGVFTAPQGWTTEFAIGECWGRNETTCGTWKARMTTNRAGSSTAHFSVATASCYGPHELDVAITVADPEATWTKTEKVEVQDHSRSPHARGGKVDLGVALLWAPNTNQTTRPGWGFGTDIGVLATKHLRLGASFRYMETGVPVEASLYPVAWQVTETSYGSHARVLGVITPAPWMGIELGGQAGVLVLGYPQINVTAEDTVQEETQVTPTMGVLAGVNFYPGKVFLLGLGFGCDITLTDVRRRVGSGYGGTGGTNEDANKANYAYPFFAFKIGARL